MTAGAPGLSARRAAILGAVQGPAELLPVSSSAHLSLMPWFRGWRWDELDPEARKSFEVALHAGTAAALLIGQRPVIAAELAAFDTRRAAVVALSFVPPAIAGYALERQIEGRLGGPGSIAAGLIAGALAMVAADRRPQRRGPGDAPADGLALGLAQAAALIPGVSRNGATLTAARRAVHARARQPALANGRAAGDRRRDGAQGGAPTASRTPRELRRAIGAGVATSFVHPGLPAAHLPRGARSGAVAVRGVPPGPRDRRCGENAATVSDRDAYGAAGVSQRDADRAVEALVRHLQLIDTGKPSRIVDLPGHYASVLRLGDEIGIAIGTDGVDEDDRRRAARALRHDRHRLRGDERQRPDLRRRRAGRDGRFHPLRARRPRGLRRDRRRSAPRGRAGRDRDPRRRDRPGRRDRERLGARGTAIGTVALDALVTGESIEPGDAVLGLPSSAPFQRLHARAAGARRPRPGRGSRRQAGPAPR